MAVLWLALSAVLAGLLLAAHRLYAIAPCFNAVPPRARVARSSPRHVLFLLGSGGHTAEMLSLISALPPRGRFTRTYVFSSGDSLSAQKASAFESRLQSEAGAPPLEARSGGGGGGHIAESTPAKHRPYSLREIPRARSVGQSWLSTPWSCVSCLFGCVRAFAGGDTLPDVVVCNGPGSAVVMVAVCFLLRFLGLCSTRTIYVESFARVRSLSLSGRILYPFVDRFVVQWPGLRARYRRAEYYGVLV